MRISVKHPVESGRIQLHVLAIGSPWRITSPGESEEALLEPKAPAFLAEGYPGWLRAICDAADADRQLALAIVAEVRRRTR